MMVGIRISYSTMLSVNSKQTEVHIRDNHNGIIRIHIPLSDGHFSLGQHQTNSLSRHDHRDSAMERLAVLKKRKK